MVIFFQKKYAKREVMITTRKSFAMFIYQVILVSSKTTPNILRVPSQKKTWAVHHDQKIFVLLNKIGSFSSLRHSSSILHFTSYCSTWRKLKSVMIYADGFHIRLVASFVDSWKFLSWSCSFEWISNNIVGKWGEFVSFPNSFLGLPQNGSEN